MNLTPNFTLREFGDPPAGEYRNNALLVARALEIIRARIDAPIIVTSGWRERFHNLAVGGVPTSDHQRALAVDFRAEGFTSEMLANHACIALTRAERKWDQLIYYSRSRHVHLGMGEKRRCQLFWSK